MIDGGIPDEWDPEVRSACARFRQGHLLETPPLFYAAAPAHGVWALTRAAGDLSLAEDLLECKDRPPYGLITTETCDLSEEAAARPRQPWISVAPVYDLAGQIDAGQVSNLRSHRVQYVRLLDAPELPSGMWVADFRIEIPIEKSWLVGRNPIESYASDQDYTLLARALAARRERPVYADEVHRALTRPLRRWIERMKPDRRVEVLDVLTEVRILFAGNCLDPDAASLLLLTDSQELGESAKREWDAKWEDLKVRMDNVGISLLTNEYRTLDTCPTRLYLDSFQIDLSFALVAHRNEPW